MKTDTVCSPCKNKSPSTESSESIVLLSSSVRTARVKERSDDLLVDGTPRRPRATINRKRKSKIGITFALQTVVWAEVATSYEAHRGVVQVVDPIPTVTQPHILGPIPVVKL